MTAIDLSRTTQSFLRSLTPQAELALLARALYREGYDDHDVGHITYRQPDGTLLAIPAERGWNEVTVADIIRIDQDGHKLEGDWNVPPAIVLHVEYHRAHPGVIVTVHQHPRFTTIWSAAGRLPGVYDQRSANMPDSDIVFYDDYKGAVLEVDAARDAVASMGDAPCTILRNHGCFVVGDSIARAYFNASSLEWRSRQAWMAEAIGAKSEMPDVGRRSMERVMAGYDWTSPRTWDWAMRRELGPIPDVMSDGVESLFTR